MSDASETAEQATIQQQLELLAKHRTRLKILSGQEAHFVSIQTAPHILSEIRETQKALRSIKARLRAVGVPIADEPNDGPAEVPTTSTHAAVAPTFQVPYPPNPLFIGREHELEHLVALLDSNETIAVVPAIAGTGGIGKTMLAAEFAHRYQERFPGGVFWLNMERPEGVAGQIAACAGPGGLHLPGYEAWSFEDRIAATRTAWRQPIRRLLIFDSLEDPALLSLRPTDGGSQVLITTRRVAWANRSGVRTIPLYELARPDSLHLLLTPRYGSTFPDDPAANAICEALGDLPLALALAGAYLEHYPSVTLATYATQITSNPVAHESLNAVLEEGLPTRHATSIVATFALSYNRLQTDDPIDLLARTLLHRAAYCALAPIPRALLSYTDAPEQEAMIYQRDVDAALHRLLAVGLLDDLDSEGVRLHRLLAAFVRSVTPDPDQEQQWISTVLAKLLYEINNAGYPLAGLPYLEHARYIASTATNNATYVDLFNSLGYLLQAMGDLAAARPYYQCALDICEHTLGSHHSVTARSLNNLGALLQEVGDLAAARPYLECALDICEHTLGSDHPITARSLNNLGHLLQKMGDLTTAQSYYERALDIRERTVGSDHPDTAISLNNLGLLLQDMGDLTTARSYYEQALAIQERTLGSDHPATANSLSSLGYLLQAMGDLGAARSYYERALDIQKRFLGSNHPATASSLSNLGTLLQAMGDLAAARPYLECALDICERMLGPNHPDTAQILNNLGVLLRSLGDLAAARSHYERALDIQERVLGPDHPNTAQILNNLGYLLRSLDELAAARPYYQRALDICERVLGPDHPNTARSLNNLGYLLQAMGDLEDAQPYYKRALDICERVLGPDHPTTTTIRRNLATLDSVQPSPQADD